MSEEELNKLVSERTQRMDFHYKFLVECMKSGDSGGIYKHLGKVCQEAELIAYKGREFYDKQNKDE